MSDPMGLEVQAFKSEHDLYLSLSGRLVRSTCPVLDAALDAHFSPSFERLLLNLRNLTFIDSSGLGKIVSQKVRCAREHMQFVVLEPSPTVSSVLSVSKLDAIFPVITGREAVIIRNELEVAIPHKMIPHVEAEETYEGNFAVRPDVSALKPNERIVSLCRQAITKVRLGELDEAVSMYRQVLDLDPECLAALNNLALLYEQRPAMVPLAIKVWEQIEQMSRDKEDQKHLLRARRRLEALKDTSLSSGEEVDKDQDTIFD